MHVGWVLGAYLDVAVLCCHVPCGEAVPAQRLAQPVRVMLQDAVDLGHVAWGVAQTGGNAVNPHASAAVLPGL